jgi:phosphoglycerate dehydrogenase-like enzyme
MNIAMFETEEWERQACVRLEPHRPDEAAAARLKFADTSLGRLLSDSDVVTLHLPATRRSPDG